MGYLDASKNHQADKDWYTVYVPRLVHPHPNPFGLPVPYEAISQRLPSRGSDIGPKEQIIAELEKVQRGMNGGS